MRVVRTESDPVTPDVGAGDVAPGRLAHDVVAHSLLLEYYSAIPRQRTQITFFLDEDIRGDVVHMFRLSQVVPGPEPRCLREH